MPAYRHQKPVCVKHGTWVAKSVARFSDHPSSLNWPDWRPIRAQGLETQNNKTGEY